MRLVHRPALDRFRDQLTVGGSHFLPEMVILAQKSGASILEVPVSYRPRRGQSKITGDLSGTVKVGTNMVALILAYRLGTTPPR
jgi:hypothetical protein